MRLVEHQNYGKGILVKVAVEIGDTYAIPLTGNRFGICRVINTSACRSEKFQGFLGFDAPLVTASHFSFDRLPTIVDIHPCNNLYLDNLNSFMKSNDPAQHLIKFYVHTNPPDDFIFLGNIAPMEIETGLPAITIGDWRQLENQWKR